MDKLAFREDLNITRVPEYIKNKIEFAQAHPFWFRDIGTMCFCGHQGAGKTLSAVNYIYNLYELYPLMIFVSNVTLTDYPFNAGYRVDKKTGKTTIYDLKTNEEIILGNVEKGEYNALKAREYKYICIEYDGLDCLKHISNGEYGVVFFIDELHLELNSLESKNVDIEIMIEISQQRKQRKKIIGTSQVYFRLAKPLREQIFDIVLCENYFGCLQFNKSIDGFKSKEDNGKLKAHVNKRSIYFHTFEMYGRYDTYAKMKRYNKEWNGRPRVVTLDNTEWKVGVKS